MFQQQPMSMIKSASAATASAAAQAAATCSAQMEQIIEEHSFAVGQVNFLNSIIADMHRKNEELQARIEILESGNYNSETQSQAEV